MTYSDNDPTTKETTPPPAAFPACPGIVDMAKWRGMMPVFLARLASMISQDRVERGAITLMWQLRGLLHTLYKIETQNYAIWLTRALRADPAWQAQVRRDQGGEPAIARWHERYKRRFKAPQTPRSAGDAAREKPERKDRKKPMPRTDRHGLFRLSVIAREGCAPRRKQEPTPRPARNVGAVLSRPEPVQITPQDLRPQSGNTENTGKARKQRSDIPAPKRHQLADIWDALQADHHKWNERLMQIDLAITEPELREGLDPP